MMNSMLKKTLLLLIAITTFCLYTNATSILNTRSSGNGELTKANSKLEKADYLKIKTVLNSNSTNPPLKIILKLDDLYASSGVSTALPALNYLVSMKIKAGLGFVSSRNDASALSIYGTYLNAKNLNGESLFEVWHHGFDHIDPEFDNTTYAYQKQHFEDADISIKNNLRVQMRSFGAPYNQSDQTTNTVISENSNYKVTMLNSPAPPASTGILNLTNRVNFENGTGIPDYDFFIENYNFRKVKYFDNMVLQGHPGQWDAAKVTEFSRIIDFLISEGAELVTPYEYYLSLNPSIITPAVSQTISFSSLPSKMREDADFAPGATSSSGLTVTYNSSNPSVAVIVDGKIKLVGSGSTVITASQMGDATYKPADYVSHVLSVSAIDYRSITSGNWNTPSVWQIRAANGSWSTATVAPSSSNNVFVQNGHTITVDASDANCYDLNINATTSGSQGVLDITGAFNVNVYGKIRAYTGPAEVSAVDGNYMGVNTTALISYMINTNSTGLLRFVGDSRIITSTGEWNGIGPTHNSEFALDAGAVGVLNTAMKCKTFTFTSGTISTNSTLNVGSSSTTFNGVLTIKNGARLISSKSRASSGNQVFTYNNAGKCGEIIIDAGGVLELTGATPAMDVVTFTNNGTVIYSGSAVQTFINLGNDASSLKQFNYTNLIIDNPNGVAAVASSSNTGNFINNGGVLTLANGVLTTGNLTVPSGTISVVRTEGSLSAAINGVVNVTYNGGSNLTSGAELPTSVNNLIINNHAEVTLENSKTVTGTLTLLNGILNIPSSDELHVSSGNQIAGSFNVTNHIKTLKSGSNIGKLRLSSFANANTFPVGGTNYFLPVIFTPNSVSDITVSVFEGATTNATPNGAAFSIAQKNDIVDAVYQVSRTLGTGNYNLTLGWDEALEGTNFSGLVANEIEALQYKSSVYESVTGGADNSSNTITLAGLSDFAPILIGKTNALLPIHLMSFIAQKQNDGVQLRWITASETNNSHFEIQRSFDGLQFESIGKVNGSNNSHTILTYNFFDKKPAVGTNYYRLNQVDFDGKSTLSNIASISMGFTGLTMQVSPEIGSDHVNVTINSDKVSDGELEIYNTNGQKIIQQKVFLNKGVNIFSVDMSGSGNGVYIANYRNDFQVLRSKFLK